MDQGLVAARLSHSVSAAGSLGVYTGLWGAVGRAEANSSQVQRGWEAAARAHLPLPGSVAEGQEDTILSYEPVTRQESKS